DELFVHIPPGTVEMRDDRTKKVWLAEIASFELSKFPVTQELYQAITKENPSTFKGKKLPVETISWIEAVNLCNQLSEILGETQCYSIDLDAEEITLNSCATGFRLPTEVEWQYACQAGSKDIRYGELNDIAW